MIRKIIKKIQNNRLLFLLFAFILFQLLIILFFDLGQKLGPKTTNCVYSEQKVNNPISLWPRANFDGMHYLSIAKNGYSQYQQAFFPFYPLLIKFLTPVFAGKDLVAALFISSLSLLGGIYFLYQLVLLDYKEKIAKRTVFFLLIFPSAFFFALVYTESLFLFLSVGAFYFARTKNWVLAGILAGLASATRLVGIFLLPALLVEWIQQDKFKNQISKIKIAYQNIKRKNIFEFSPVIFHFSFLIFNLLPLFLVPLGLLFYMRFLAINYQDPLLFLHVQPAFGVQRSADKLILYYQVIWRYLKMIAATKPDPLFFTVWIEFISTLSFLILIVIAYFKKIRMSYLVYTILSYFVSTLTGTFVSMPRFLLVLFPCFICLALIENKLFRLAISIIFLIISFSMVSLFVRGYFVS